MQSLARLRQTFGREKALAGSTVLLNMHLTPETLALGRVLRAGGARLIFLPSNRNPAPPEIVREAEDDGRVLAGAQELAAVDWRATAPCLVVEGNGRIFRELHRPEDSGLPVGEGIVAISEHTSGGGRMVDRFDGDRLRVPVVAVYRDRLKTRLETGLGTSQTVVAALIRGLRRPVAGRRTVVIGFGHVGRGVATSLRTLGARLLVVDVRGEALLEARLAGFAVAELEQALPKAELCVTTTGVAGVLDAGLLAQARAGLVLANVSNQPREIDLSGCERLSGDDLLSFWSAPGGPRFGLLGGGLQVNHVIEQGNPAELMDLSFTLHALILRWLLTDRPAPGLYPVPEEVRQEAAQLVLESYR